MVSAVGQMEGIGSMRSHFCGGWSQVSTFKQRLENSEGMSHKTSEGKSKSRSDYVLGTARKAAG